MTKSETNKLNTLYADAAYECWRIVDDFKLIVNAFTPGVGDKIDEDYFIKRFKKNLAKTVKVLFYYDIEENDNDKGRQNQAEGD